MYINVELLLDSIPYQATLTSKDIYSILLTLPTYSAYDINQVENADKNVKKKVMYDVTNKMYCCPTCLSPLKKKIKYCKYCTQWIDWSEEAKNEVN